MRHVLLVLAALLLCHLASPARAHTASSAYLSIAAEDDGATVRLSLALRDLAQVVDLRPDDAGRITWGGLRHRRAEIGAYVLAHLQLSADGAPCGLAARRLAVDTLPDGGYAVLDIAAACGARPHRIGLSYSLFFDIDRLHRALVTTASLRPVVIGPDTPTLRIDLSAAEGGADFRQTFTTFVATGFDHLLTGIDHMLFIAMLLVPAVFVRRGGQALPAPGFVPVLLDAAKVLSAFTLAHGTTLTLSVLHLVRIPERLSESGIAITVLLTALDNIFHVLPGRRWPLAFVFGLVHGLGFATALGPLDLPPLALAVALLSFSLGLELAQFLVALTVLPAAYLCRHAGVYRRRIVPGVSTAVGMVALAWFTDRACGLGIMPF